MTIRSFSFVLMLAACAALAAAAELPTDKLLLKDYRPQSIFKIPETHIDRARFPVIDMHAHSYAANAGEVGEWVKTMDEINMQKTVVLSGKTGAGFDAIAALYAKYPGRFMLWCGLDTTGFDKPGFGPAAIAELERCHKAGAVGVGEMIDKGRGLGGPGGWGLHLDDPRMDAILERCADLGMPFSIHVAEDRWMYEPLDAHNDGLMNAAKWHVDNAPDVLQHDAMVQTLENTLKKHTRTIFVACHFANCCSDLSRLGEMFEKYPNLYADISARYAETAPIPRYMAKFYAKYQDRLVYGTDMNRTAAMYRSTFRILESDDEHMYVPESRKYHWPVSGLALPGEVLKKLYHDNPEKVIKLAKDAAR